MSPVDESVDPPRAYHVTCVVVDQPSSTCSVGLSHGLVGERGVFDACRLGVRIALKSDHPLGSEIRDLKQCRV
jgi:hypothetical protein